MSIKRHTAEEIVRLACQYGRRYRRSMIKLHKAGWQIDHKSVERIWRQEGLEVPRKQPKRRWLRLNDGSRIRLRPEQRNHVWSYDFLTNRRTNGRAIRMLTDALFEAQVIIARWRREYNTVRPHSLLGYVPPAPEIILPAQANQLDLNRDNDQIQVGTP